MPTYIEETCGAEYIKPDWDKYRGSNHHHIPERFRTWGGGIELAHYWGKPLCQNLWDDLLYRVKIDSLWVIGHNQEQWTISPFGRGVVIGLDEAGNINRFHISV